MKTCPTCHSIYPNHFAVCPRDATPLAEAEGWSEGTVIRGKYRILSKVGQGGMGAVYKALHTKFDQLRALKVMSGDLAADPDFVKRFEREAVLMSKLQHPNVVRVDDIDESEDGRPFIVMEFVEGRSLRQVIQQEGPLAPLRVCSIAKQAAAGLEAAHLLGMVHRDVKPENIVLVDTAEGEKAKVLDFGIAKLKEARLGDGFRTATGVIVGTPQYLSPEQAMGKRSEELDGRSDLYSLGLVMYQMLTRELPFQADSAAGWLLARVQEPPRPIRSARPDLAIPDALANLVMRCLEKDRGLRPANARDLIREIERAEEEIRRPAKPVAPPAVTAPAPLPPRAEPVAVSEPLPEPAPKATSTSRWARGWRFWAGLAAIMLAPIALGPLFDLTRFSDHVAWPAYWVAVAGGVAWCAATRKHLALRLPGLLIGVVFVVLLGARVTYIYQGHPWETRPRLFYTIEELKQASRCPVEVESVTRSIDSQTQQVVFNLVFRNISSDARVTDWKADTINFNADGKVLSDTSPVNRTPISLEPGQTLPMQLTGHLQADLRGVSVIVDPQKMLAYGLSLPEIVDRLRASPQIISVGKLDKDYSLCLILAAGQFGDSAEIRNSAQHGDIFDRVAAGQARDLEEIGNSVVAAGSQAPIRLRDVAEVREGNQDPRAFVDANAQKVSKVKVVFKEVDYEITTSAGTKEAGSWINPHFQEDLQKAKQP